MSNECTHFIYGKNKIQNKNQIKLNLTVLFYYLDPYSNIQRSWIPIGANQLVNTYFDFETPY